MKTLNNFKKSKGFTLVELLVVIAIIAILSVTAYVALSGQTGKARDSRRQSDLNSIQLSLAIYFSNESNYPETLDDLVTEGNLGSIPLDPTTESPYPYARSVNGKQYQIGATLEGDDGTYSAYVVGNLPQGEAGLLPQVKPPEGSGCDGKGPVNGSLDCVPIDIWTP